MDMMTLFAEKRNQIRYSLICLACVLIIGIVDSMGFFQGMDSYVYDLFLRFRSPEPISDRIVIAAIDEKTLAKLGRWPITRHHYVTFFDRVKKSSAILFDIILAEPSSGDLQLADRMAQTCPAVMPVYFDHRLKLVLPAPSLRKITMGHVHVEPGMDGVVRDVFHTLVYQGKRISSISSVVHGLVSGMSSGREFSFPEDVGRTFKKSDEILQMDRMRINYYGPRGTFPYLSFSDIVQNKYTASYFTGKIVLLGLTASGTDKAHLIPFSQDRNRMPGVETQAHILNNLMYGTDIKPVSRNLSRVVAGLMFILWFLVFIKNSSIRTLMIWTAIFLSLSALVFVLLSRFHIWLPPLVFYVTLIAAWVTAYLFNQEKMGMLLAQAKKDWEISFNSITDGIIIQNSEGDTVLRNRSAGNEMNDFFSRHKEQITGLSSKNDKQGSSEIFDDTLNRYFEVCRFSRKEENSSPNGIVYIIRDITEKKNFQREHRVLQAQLIQSQKLEAIGTLAGGIAHDFNNILTAIMGYTQLAAIIIPKDNKAHAKLEDVLKACSRAANLVMQILSFSRQTKQQKRPVMLRPIVKEVLKLLTATLPPTIELKETVNGKEKVYGDPSQIYQVILNLCTNASHALAGGPGQISVSMESLEISSPDEAAYLELKTGRYVKMSISDTGSGIPDDIKPRVFEPYFTTKSKETGTGLGLATAHGIVKNHGGCIRFESKTNEGTIFHVYLPLVDTPDTHLAFDSSQALGSMQGRLLFVDDQDELLETSQKLLENLGYSVTAKNCPQKALEAFQGNPESFDVVITDLSMKKMTGITLSKKLLAIKNDIPIILCTGFNDETTKDMISKAGVCSSVTKPFLIHELTDKIQDVLKEKRP